MVQMEADVKNGDVVIVSAGGRVGDIVLEVSACMISLAESLMEQGVKKEHVVMMLTDSFNGALAYLEDNGKE